jgi:hypothetical protein
VITSGGGGLGRLRTHASTHGRRDARDPFPCLRLHTDRDETELLAAAQQLGFGNHVLADRGGQVAHLHLGRVPGAGLLAERGTSHGLATDGAERGGTAAVQGLARIRVLVLIGKDQARTRLVEMVETHAQEFAVGRVFDPASDFVHGWVGPYLSGIRQE